jgi:hypothetical protein
MHILFALTLDNCMHYRIHLHILEQIKFAKNKRRPPQSGKRSDRLSKDPPSRWSTTHHDIPNLQPTRQDCAKTGKLYAKELVQLLNSLPDNDFSLI